MGSDFFTTIFLFLNEYNSNNPGDAVAVNALATEQSINGAGPNGVGETNNGAVITSLPIYNVATVNGGAINICTNSLNGDFNKLGARAYVIFNVTSPGTHIIRMTRTSGDLATDPNFFVFRNGEFIIGCLLYTSPSPRDGLLSRMPSSA